MADFKGFTPVPLPETAPYWAAARRHVLELPYCTACGAFHYYPRATCPHCLSSALEWRRVSGRGRLHTFTVVHRGPRDFPLGTPYVLAVVELDEGPRLMTNLVGVPADPAAVRIGMPVEVTFVDLSDAVALPHFRPVESAS
ncbi:MAG TPA: Zn-ribbon domain-containing OB-fold protein [Candidatus Limnocylindria bacterium]|nr:Zn-ribbon domain-containing OB-fold protein [Candidatus Limnocylindria bacterium]